MATPVHCVEAGPWELEQLGAAFAAHPELRPWFLPGPAEEHLGELHAARVLSPFIYSNVDAAALEQMPALELIATRSTGFDHVDLDTCAERGITVVNVPTYGENTVAEHTFAMILALSRRLLAAEQKGRTGEEDRWALQGFDLAGRTLGVVGAGRIGLHVIRIGRALGMEVLAYDAYPQAILAEVLDFRYVDMRELLAQSHVVSLHAPATPETFHLIDAAALAQMRPEAVLVNTARGSLVDTEALIAALDAGRLAGVGLDVFEGEHVPQEDEQLLSEEEHVPTVRRRLAERENVILTPHNGFNSSDAVRRIADTTVANVRAYLRGEPRNVVGGAPVGRP